MLTLGHTGQPLQPHDLSTAWDLSPTSLVLASVVFWLFWRNTKSATDGKKRIWFASGFVLLLVATISPLDALSESLASAHMVQHLLLILGAGPALALSRPVETVLSGLPRSLRKATGRARRWARLTPSMSRRLIKPVTTWLFLVGSLWIWHASGPYELALQSELVHLVEHGVFLIGATLFWSVVLVDQRLSPVSPGFRIMAVFTLALQGVLLAALLTFANEPWYESYTGTAPNWGLDPLADQQLAGLIMWIPSGLILTGIGVSMLVMWLGSLDDEHESAASDLSYP